MNSTDYLSGIAMPTRHWSHHHEAAAASHIFLRRRQSYLSESKSVIFHVAAAPLN